MPWMRREIPSRLAARPNLECDEAQKGFWHSSSKPKTSPQSTLRRALRLIAEGHEIVLLVEPAKELFRRGGLFLRRD